MSLGYDGSNVYDVLYNREYFISICSVLVIASIVGAVMNVIPFFFYDLTEARQKAMINVLKIRALFEDYGNNVLADEKLIEAVEIINEAKQYAGKTKIENAKKKDDREFNEKIEVANLVMQELNRFNTEFGIKQIENAALIYNAGVDGFLTLDLPTKAAAKAMPKSTELEKENRRNALIQASNILAAKKAIKKYFPNGIVEFDVSVFEELFKAEDENELAIHEALLSMKQAKEHKADTKELKDIVKKLQFNREKIKQDIKDATNQYSIYYRAVKPYIDAKKVLAQKDNYEHFDEIIELYKAALERVQ